MRLMQKYDKDEGIIGVDDLKRWPIGSAAVSFLSATGATRSIKSLKMVRSPDKFPRCANCHANSHELPLVAAKRNPAGDLIILARAALLSNQVKCIYKGRTLVDPADSKYHNSQESL